MKTKKVYQQPETAVTRVELESPICSGSVDITAQSPVTQTEAQEVNSSFAYDNTFTGATDKWD